MCINIMFLACGESHDFRCLFIKADMLFSEDPLTPSSVDNMLAPQPMFTLLCIKIDIPFDQIFKIMLYDYYPLFILMGFPVVAIAIILTMKYFGVGVKCFQTEQ